MTKRYLVSVALCFLFGLLFSLKNQYWIVVPFLILEIYIFLRLYKYNMKVRGYLLSGLLFVIFFFSCLYGKKTIEKNDRCLMGVESNERIMVQGRLCKKEAKNKRYYLYLDEGRILLENESVYCGDILVVSDSEDYILGNILVVEGKNKEFETSPNEGGYDEKEVYLAKGIVLKIDPVIKIIEYGKGDSLREKLYSKKEKMKMVMNSYLKEDDAGVLSSIVLGDRTDLSIEDKESYSNAGISHVLSVSGLHISLLCMGVYKFLRKTRLPVFICALLTSIFSVGYCLFSGSSISTVRAVGMFIVSMLAMVLGEAYDLISALSLLAIIVLVNNPYALFSTGFLLSFSAVIGIAVTGKELSDFYERIALRRDFVRKRKREIYGRKVPQAVEVIRKYFDDFEKMILINIGIIVTTLPFVAWFYYEIPTLSIFVNILVLPLVGILLGMGFLGSLLGSYISYFGYLLKPCGLIVGFYRLVADSAGNVNYSKWIIGRPSVISIVVYFLVLGIFLCFLRCAQPTLDVNGEKIGAETRRFNGYNAFFVLGTVIVIFGLFFELNILDAKKPCIKMLDVGQGDGIYIKTTAGENLFIDGGSSSIKQVGKYRIAPFLKCVGVRNVDFWLISHTDEDHVSGLIELLEEGYSVKNVVMSKYVIRNEIYQKLLELCEQNDVEILFLQPGDLLDFGDERITCLYPYKYSDSENDSSMVMFYETKQYDILFTGDMGKVQEVDLMREWEWPRGDKEHILKVAHHGSKNSSDESFIRMCHPDISIISAGKNNSYGHPHIETIEKLNEIHSEIRRTDLEGEIIIE